MHPKPESADKSVGILFLHHSVNAVVLRNLHSIRDWNPDAMITTMSAGEPLPGGRTIATTPALAGLHSRDPTMSADVLVCSWYLQRKECCDKWWIVEWDTFCAVSARSYYAPVWQFPFVASMVKRTYRDPDWYWFTGLGDFPKAYRDRAMGAVPFIYLLSNEALMAICGLLLAEPTVAGNCELRFATAANRLGVAPCAYSPPDDRITWIPWQSPLPDDAAIFHPVKHLVGPPQQHLECH